MCEIEEARLHVCAYFGTGSEYMYARVSSELFHFGLRDLRLFSQGSI